MGEEGMAEPELRKVARDKTLPWPKRAAANRILRTLELPDLADFQDAADGVSDLKSLRGSGLNTEVVKKIKTRTKTFGQGDEATTEVEREIELFDRAGVDFDRVCDRTEGKATQRVELDANLNIPHLVRVVTPLTVHELPPSTGAENGG